MTTIQKRTFKCAVCGTEERYNIVFSSSTLGSPDLDLRPAEMKRSTMEFWIQECPKCGYVSKTVSEDPINVTYEWLHTKAYIDCDGLNFRSVLAVKFYKYYLINIRNGCIGDAYYALLNAAWACDDVGDIINADKCRKSVIQFLDGLITENPYSNSEDLKLRKIDLMRRSGQFELLIAEFSSCSFEDEMKNQILAFQLDKAAKKDSGCYTIEDAVGTEN